jgi:hypothetical protein
MSTRSWCVIALVCALPVGGCAEGSAQVPTRCDDFDGDGAGAGCRLEDCDDRDPARAPGRTDRCGDGVDQDCDGTDPPCDGADAGPMPAPMMDAGAPPEDAGGGTDAARADAGRPCGDLGLNACGGCSVLDHDPGDACGACGDGRYVCNGTEALRCDGPRPTNPCGGCSTLSRLPGQPCCDGRSLYECAGPDAVRCEVRRVDVGDCHSACHLCAAAPPIDCATTACVAGCGACVDCWGTCREDGSFEVDAWCRTCLPCVAGCPDLSM